MHISIKGPQACPYSLELAIKLFYCETKCSRTEWKEEITGSSTHNFGLFQHK